MKSLWDAQGYPNNVEDYRRFPIWLMEETLEGTIFLPVEVSDPLIYGEEDDMYADALLVFCAFQLRDGTHMEGVVTLIENWDSKLEQMCGFKEIRAKYFWRRSILDCSTEAQRSLPRVAKRIRTATWKVTRPDNTDVLGNSISYTHT